ncbi:MAG TPA: hypothetical protein VFV33_05455 [Gemmatimonadaceae bacterium]|nr:hypothetical protein [Gemmatimonadaceae bacterium]
MTRHILLPALAAVAAVALTATVAHAQQRTASPNRTQRVVATYDFGARRLGLPLPMTVTVADSAGTLVANARLQGETGTRPLEVSVIENDLVLQGETPDGVLTLVLDQQATGTEGKLTSGRWAVGSAEGKLRARKGA